MSVKLRLVRIGRRHRPFFRINAVESTTPRNGKILEKVGHYDPIEKDPAKQLVLKRERIQYWLDKGAIPSETVAQILSKQGISKRHAEERRVRRAKARKVARATGRPFTKAERAALKKPEKKEGGKTGEAEKAKT
jgi:small subunit ribosomal protein S16